MSFLSLFENCSPRKKGEDPNAALSPMAILQGCIGLSDDDTEHGKGGAANDDSEVSSSDDEHVNEDHEKHMQAKAEAWEKKRLEGEKAKQATADAAKEGEQQKVCCSIVSSECAIMLYHCYFGQHVLQEAMEWKEKGNAALAGVCACVCTCSSIAAS